MKIVDAVRELVNGIIADLGYELYDIDYAKEAEGYVLTVYIDSSAGIKIEDCEKVSRAIEPVLDEHDPIPQAYFLSVSSVGLDRAFKLDSDFQRAIGKAIDIKLYAPIEKKKLITGTLVSYDGDIISVEVDGNTITIPRKGIAQIKLHIDF